MSPRPRPDDPVADRSADRSDDPIRYAVVGLGWFAQVAVLPAFAHAGDGSRLAALVSGDPEKLRTLGERHGVERRVGYDGYQELLASGDVDAVYITLPNHLHHDYAIAAAEAGIDVLCEKPLAVTVEQCREMIAAAEANGVKLMTAYRLHFERANLEAIEIVRSGRIGTPRLFSSVFASRVTNQDDIRLNPTEEGGGSVWDLGVYCINAARYLFRAEPTEVMAFTASGAPRFARTDEMTAALLRFPGERLASFTSSLGAHDRDGYRILGTEGELVVEPGYEFKAELRHRLTVGDETTETRFDERDQVAPEIAYFSRCILEDEDPEPSGREGLADVRVIRALYRSAEERRPILLDDFAVDRRPSLELEDERQPPPGHQDLVHTEAP